MTGGSLRVGNVYGHGFDRARRGQLEALGFALRPETSRFAGTQICSFLDFTRGPALEVVEVEDEERYVDFALPGMEPYCPGISLVATEECEITLEDLERRFDDLSPYRLHVAYDGTDDPAAPGWNYLNFATPVAPGTFIWFTTFDEPRPTRSYRTTHPNGVVGAVGLVFDQTIGDLERLASLGGARIGPDVFRIDGMDIWTKPVAAGLPSAGQKVFPLVAVVLAAPRVDQLAQAENAVEISFLDEPAVLIRTNPRSWDLVVRPGQGG